MPSGSSSHIQPLPSLTGRMSPQQMPIPIRGSRRCHSTCWRVQGSRNGLKLVIFSSDDIGQDSHQNSLRGSISIRHQGQSLLDIRVRSLTTPWQFTNSISMAALMNRYVRTFENEVTYVRIQRARGNICLHLNPTSCNSRLQRSHSQ